MKGLICSVSHLSLGFYCEKCGFIFRFFLEFTYTRIMTFGIGTIKSIRLQFAIKIGKTGIRSFLFKK